MNKLKVALSIYKSIDKALLKIIRDLAKKYLKPLKDKPWYDLALKEYEEWTIELLELLDKQSKDYAKLIRGKKLFKQNTKVSNLDYSTDEYLDSLHNKVVVDDVRDSLVEMEKDFEEELLILYQKKDTQLVLEAAKLTSKNLGFKFNFNKFDNHTRDYLRDKSIKWARQVQSTTEKSIKKILVKGFEDGLGSYDIADLIREDTNFSYKRSEAIARTEIISSSNYADNAMYDIDENIIGKEWRSTSGSRTRESHASANGQRVKKDKPFIVGGEKLNHPGDNSLGASAKNVINCRCTTLPIFRGEKI